MILLGNGGVGKSSLMARYVNNVFEEKTLHTIGVEFLTKSVLIGHITFSLQIWDTGGQERFKSLRTPFYKGSDVCILVFDLTEEESFVELNYWLQEFRKYSLEAEDVPFLLLGNKADLANRVVDSQRIYEWCKENSNIPYLETSAKLDINVEKGFSTILEMAKERETRSSGISNSDQYNGTIKLNKDTEKKKSCCSKLS